MDLEQMLKSKQRKQLIKRKIEMYNIETLQMKMNIRGNTKSMAIVQSLLIGSISTTSSAN